MTTFGGDDDLGAAGFGAAPPAPPPGLGLGRGLLDTRSLTKPGVFSGKETDWAEWVFTWRAWVALLSERLSNLLRWTEEQREPPNDEAVEPEDRRLSEQFFFVLVMQTKGRAQQLL